MPTRSQRYAESAYGRVATHLQESPRAKKEYLNFARAFPTLLHTCGLAQALAYAAAKQGAHEQVLDDLSAILGQTRDLLLLASRQSPLPRYMRLSREALFAASWLKRQAEAQFATDIPPGGDDTDAR